HRRRYYCCSEFGLGRALEASRLRPGVHSAARDRLSHRAFARVGRGIARLARQDRDRVGAGGGQQRSARGTGAPRLREPGIQDLRVAASASLGQGAFRQHGRLVHYLRGVKIGVALGGGAARGMAHLGVLNALDQNGIVVDVIAGTSVGAMTGILYCAGLDCDYVTNQFAAYLKLPWIFRQLPSGGYWYLLYKYRRGQFEPILRKYLHDWKLEQLAIPCSAVTADLVGGQAVVRDRGGAVQAILESINLPMLSAPICRNGQALVDGGVMNNIPADVLTSAGCNFVIAVSVTAKIEKQVCAHKPDTPTLSMRIPSSLQTLLRTLE